jgi:outer membrane receptor protein involved in Fe transport
MKYSKRQQLKSLALAVSVSGSAFMSGLLFPASAHSEELNTKLPATQDNHFNLPVTVDLPKQPLSMSLKEFARSSGLSLSFDNKLVDGKTAPAIKGRMTRKEVLRELLSNSGLTTELDGDSAVLKKIPDTDSTNIQLDQINVRAKRFYEVGPLPGLGLTKEQIPGNVQSITAKEIKESHSLSITDLMNKKLQSVTVNDYQGNPFQMDVQYRGFTAGPQIGTPQGLSVFFDGIRVNEPFGDVVNWDMIPMNALAGVDVFPGSNPIFGLNTLGGAFTLKTKDGFNNAGIDAEVLTGSFGRKQLQAEAGWNNGTVALFGAGNFFLEDGWRENSPSKVNQLFTKASYRGDKLDLNLSTLLVGTDLTGNGLLPSEIYAQDRNGVFSSPDTTKNRLSQFQLSSSYFVNDNFTVTGQVYRRNSKRHQVGADVMRNYDEELTAKSLPPAGADGVFTCLFRSSKANQYGLGSQANRYGLPDYLVIPVEGYDPVTNSIINSTFFDELLVQGTFDLNNYIGNINQELPNDFVAGYRKTFEVFRNFTESEVYNRNNASVPQIGTNNPAYFNEATFIASFNDSLVAPGQSINGVIFDNSYFFSQDAVTNVITKNYVFLLGAINEADCATVPILDVPDPNFPFLTQNVDGVGLNQPGYVQGTPTAVFTDNQIDQVVDGASLQFNWNFEKHKFMIGASIDAAEATYENEQRLGFLDANRKAYLDPAQAHPQFAGAFVGLRNNDFEGTNTTKSIYFSETWTPTKEWNFNASARYNLTKTKNVIAARSGLLNYGIGELIANPDKHNICTDIDNDGDVDAADCAGVPTGYRPLRLNDTLGPSETEKFSYYSFNPSLGVTWQAKENLNMFANWSKGTRTPSVIELGCALDKTPTGPFLNDGNGNIYQEPRSLAENRQCTLPTSLSGDPYLPQIRATTYDLGMRGTLNNIHGVDRLQWNVGAYQTDLKDDIYFIAVGNGQGFFDSIGNTRRRGLEAGVSGKIDKWGFGINYGLTEATFQNDFLMYSEDNSSVSFVAPLGRVIQVKKGNRMPGVPLHNLNASISYEVTPQWQVGFSAVAHSEIFVRGNENNAHRKGVVRTLPVFDPNIGPTTRDIPATNNPGKLPGYITFNFQTSYRFNSEWTATMQVINLFDKEYFTAGRLGSNPFSPSILGAIGPSGYNHNSGDWQSTNFIAPSAPRGVWFSLNWQFDPNAKPSF